MQLLLLLTFVCGAVAQENGAPQGGQSFGEFFADNERADDPGIEDESVTMTAEEEQEKLEAIVGSDYVQAKIAGVEEDYANLTDTYEGWRGDPEFDEMVKNLTTDEKDFFESLVSPDSEQKGFDVIKDRGLSRNWLETMINVLEQGGDKRLFEYDMTYSEAAEFFTKLYHHTDRQSGFEDYGPAFKNFQKGLMPDGKTPLPMLSNMTKDEKQDFYDKLEDTLPKMKEGFGDL